MQSSQLPKLGKKPKRTLHTKPGTCPRPWIAPDAKKDPYFYFWPQKYFVLTCPLYLNTNLDLLNRFLVWINLLKTNQFIVVTAVSNIYRTILPVNMKMYKIAHYYRNQSQYHIYSHSFAHENSHMGVIHRTIIRIMPLMTIIRLLTLNLMLICRV